MLICGTTNEPICQLTIVPFYNYHTKQLEEILIRIYPLDPKYL